MAIKQKSQEEQTEFNSAIATLQRIDVIKKELDDATFNEDYEKKWRALKVYFFELISMMDEKDDKAQRLRFYEVRAMYNQYLRVKMNGGQMIPTKLFDAIDDWDIELRNLEQSYGINMPKKSDPRYALMGR